MTVQFADWLEALAKDGGKGVVGNIDARCLGRVAALLRQQAAEIERLRATINEQSAAIERADRLVLACEQHLRDAKHEITKLREDMRDNGLIR